MKTRNTSSLLIAKRLACAIAALAVLIWTCNPARAEFKGQVQGGVTYTFRVVEEGTGTAVTILEVTRGKLNVAAIYTVPSGETNDITYTVPPKFVDRVILVLDPSSSDPTLSGECIVSFIDGGVIRFTDSFVGHGELVWDVPP